MNKAIIEMPMGTKFKYEQDKETGLLKLDRSLEIPIPYNYGYIPQTLAEDNDPLDVFVVSHDPIFPLTMLDIEIVGMLKCTDNGVSDDKVIAIIKDDWSIKTSWSFNDPEKSIRFYLKNYKHGFIINHYYDIIETQKVIQECRNRFQK